MTVHRHGQAPILPELGHQQQGKFRQGETLMLNPKLSEFDCQIVSRPLIEAAVLTAGDRRVPDSILSSSMAMIELLCENPIEAWVKTLVDLGTKIGAGKFKDSTSAAMTIIMTAAAIEHVYRTQCHIEVKTETSMVSKAGLAAVKAKAKAA
jgi:hypothetical protein